MHAPAPQWTVVSGKTSGLLFLTLTRAIELTWLLQIDKACSSIYQKKKENSDGMLFRQPSCPGRQLHTL
jgi:hypothetical protein